MNMCSHAIFSEAQWLWADSQGGKPLQTKWKMGNTRQLSSEALPFSRRLEGKLKDPERVSGGGGAEEDHFIHVPWFGQKEHHALGA